MRRKKMPALHIREKTENTGTAMRTLEIYTALREHIPAELAAGWDNEGVMLLADREKDIKRALVTLDITEAAVDEAVESGCELIVSHHPVIFKPLKRLESPKLLKMVRAGISALSFHTSLDCAPGGTADTLAGLLGLFDLQPLFDEGIPCGRIGRLAEPLSFDGLVARVKKAVSPAIMQVVARRDSGEYLRVAVCPGEGKSLYTAALEAGADAYICGSMPYNEMCDASERGMTVVAAGHFETEQPVCARLAGLLAGLGVECTVFKSNPALILN